jgi:hypothetical protein
MGNHNRDSVVTTMSIPAIAMAAVMVVGHEVRGVLMTADRPSGMIDVLRDRSEIQHWLRMVVKRRTLMRRREHKRTCYSWHASPLASG